MSSVPMPPSGPGSPGGIPPHLLRRRKQVFRLRRRQFTLGPALEALKAVEAGSPLPEGLDIPEGLAPGTEYLAAEFEARLRAADDRILQLNRALEARDRDVESQRLQLAQLTEELRVTHETLDARTAAYEEAKKVVEQAKAQIARSRQEMDQQRRRLQKEKEDARKYASEDILRQLMPVVDHFTIAMEAAHSAAGAGTLLTGVEMIHREMLAVLDHAGLHLISTVGQPFDPRLHDAASTENNPDRPDGEVLRILRPGYLLGDKVLRPAMVMVNKRPAETAVPLAPAVDQLPDLQMDALDPSETGEIIHPPVSSEAGLTIHPPRPARPEAPPRTPQPVDTPAEIDLPDSIGRQDPAGFRPALQPLPEAPTTPPAPLDPRESRISPIERARRLLDSQFDER